MITLVNFADKNFRKKQKWNTFSGKFFGKFDKVFEFNKEDIDKRILELNKENLKYEEKGAGNYFWKPHIILKALKELKDGDFLMYSDSGAVFIKSVVPMVRHMQSKNKNILCYKLPFIEKQWTKRDAFLLMDSDSLLYTDSPQIMATFLLVKKNKESLNFIKRWQDYSSDSRVLSDDVNVMGKDNYPEFIEHRHDQSILSLLCKKEKNILIEGDISDYGRYPYRYLKNVKQDCLFDEKLIHNPKDNIFRGTVLCNRKNNPFIYICKYIVRSVFYKFGIKK